MPYSPSDIEQEAIKILRNEEAEWREGHAYLTDKILFKTRNIIKRARKNYFSTFDVERDPITNRKKIFLPLTRDMVETTVKNIDLDVKDVLVKAKNSNSYGIAALATYILRNALHQLRFGQILNRIIRKTCVEGVSVLKTMKTGKKSEPYKFSLVENLNFYTDPSANFLKESSGNLERHWMSIDELKSFPWKNIEYAAGTTSVERIADLQAIKTQVPYVEVWERWGKMPAYLVTGKPEDKKRYIEGTIIISNLKGEPIVHLIAENKTGKRPYTEFRTKTYDGRWLGIGLGEDLDQLQSSINETFNIRLNSARTKQLGIWKYRKGAGIKPHEIRQLYANMGIGVTRMDDLEELRTEDIKPSSYRDTEEAYLWAQRMTGAWEMSRGEQLPRVQPATTAVLQERGAKSGFNLQQEELGFALSAFFEEAFAPAIFNSLKDGEEIEIIEEPRLFEAMLKDLEAQRAAGRAVNIEKFRRTKMFKVDKASLFDPEAIMNSIQIHITGEEFNKELLIQQLNTILGSYGQLPGLQIDPNAIVKEALDIMGLGGDRFMAKTPSGILAPQQQQQQRPVQRPTEAIGQSATLEGMGMGAGL